VRTAPVILSEAKNLSYQLEMFRFAQHDSVVNRAIFKSMASNRKSQIANRKTIVLGVTGSIAAYKSAELASLLVKQKHNVFVVMTNDAVEFITPLTLQTLSKNPVTTSFYNEKENWRPGHIELADSADLLLIAPATAHIIAELAHGLGNHPLTAIALATRAPILIAPAMNGKMWEHAATQENVEKLKSRGVDFIGPEAGMLACGYEGVGRLWKVDDIAFRAEFLLRQHDRLIA
jgi:phosphopantothenoylcysteine decarboxylase/phosphopantothenate--cysteine ligase